MSYNTDNFVIKDNENFNAANYPGAMSELSALRQGIADTSVYFKVEIVVSYLKNHRLQTNWIDANPALTRMVTSGFFKTSHLESLFESGRNNKVFIKGFEEYIGKQLLMGKNKLF
jgi:hypothetical protein